MSEQNYVQFLRDLASAYRLSTTKLNKKLAEAHDKYADTFTIVPPVDPPVEPPAVSWPFPGATNPTGPKKALTPNKGSLSSSADGQIFDGITFNILNIRHNNVTIRNFKGQSIQLDAGRHSPIIEDGILDSELKVENAYQYNNATIRRVEFKRSLDGIKGHGNMLVEDCWFHDSAFATGEGTGTGNYTHCDAIQVSTGTNIIFRRNRIDNWRGNAGVFVDPDQGPIFNVTIADNYYDLVGNYPIYIKESASDPSTGLPTNVIVTGNIIGRRRTDTPPEWGSMLCEIRASNLTFKNNKTVEGKEIFLDSYGKGYTK